MAGVVVRSTARIRGKGSGMTRLILICFKMRKKKEQSTKAGLTQQEILDSVKDCDKL